MNNATKSALLESRAVLRLAGPDRFAFLQGLISQDIALAEAGRPIFTAFLTPQGKYLFDFFIVPEDDFLLLDCQAAQITDLVKHLTYYKMHSDIALHDTRDYYDVYGLWGAVSDHPRAFTDPRLMGMDERLILPRNLRDSIATNSDEAVYCDHRYKWGIAEGSKEIEAGQATLLEINYDILNAISWTKGCYIGQELTARTHYRGLIKKRYLPFRHEGEMPERHHEVMHNGHVVGRIMAAGEKYGLGLFNLEKIRPIIDEKQIIVDNRATLEVFAPKYVQDTIFPRLIG
jgi:tRNA-modifying protein YgfZ